MTANGSPLGEHAFEHEAELGPPGRAEILIPPDPVVEVDQGGGLHAVVAPGRVRLLEVDHVDLGCELAHATGEVASTEVPSRPPHPLREASWSVPHWLGADELDRKIGRWLPDEELLGGQGMGLDAVSGEPSEEPDRAATRRTAFRQRRRGQHDEHLHEPACELPGSSGSLVDTACRTTARPERCSGARVGITACSRATTSGERCGDECKFRRARAQGRPRRRAGGRRP